MPSAQLIEEIVRRILSESGLSPQKNEAPQAFKGPKILILAPKEEVDAALNRFLPVDACLDYLNSGPLSVNEIQGQGYTKLILPFVSLKTMADLALGRATGRIGRLITLLLMAGQKIHGAIFEHDTYRDTAPPALFQLYQGYEKKLTDFGFSRLHRESRGAKPLHDRLVTEKQIADLFSQGVTEIITTPGCLITALAYDLAREKGMRIITGTKAG